MRENEFLTIPDMLSTVNTRTISLLTNVKSRKLSGISRKTTKEDLKSLKIVPKVWARRSNALWDILLVTKQEAKHLGNKMCPSTGMIWARQSDHTWGACRHFGRPDGGIFCPVQQSGGHFDNSEHHYQGICHPSNTDLEEFL